MEKTWAAKCLLVKIFSIHISIDCSDDDNDVLCISVDSEHKANGVLNSKKVIEQSSRCVYFDIFIFVQCRLCLSTIIKANNWFLEFDAYKRIRQIINDMNNGNIRKVWLWVCVCVEREAKIRWCLESVWITRIIKCDVDDDYRL